MKEVKEGGKQLQSEKAFFYDYDNEQKQHLK